MLWKQIAYGSAAKVVNCDWRKYFHHWTLKISILVKNYNFSHTSLKQSQKRVLHNEITNNFQISLQKWSNFKADNWVGKLKPQSYLENAIYVKEFNWDNVQLHCMFKQFPLKRETKKNSYHISYFFTHEKSFCVVFREFSQMG